MKRAATLEMPDYSATDQIIVLSAPAGINVKVWHTGIKIAYLGSHAQPTPDSHVQAPPNWKTPVEVPVFPGLSPKNSNLESSLKWPYPPPRLSQGENGASGSRFARSDGVMKIELYCLGTTLTL